MTNREFEYLIDEQKERLFRFALSILNDYEEARDAVQDVVLKLWKLRKQLDKKQNPESFCMSTLKNHCLDLLRKQSQQQAYLHAQPEVKINLNFESVDMVNQLKTELKRLPVQQRMAIELKDFQGLEYDEICNILQQNIDAVRANVSRARKKLHEIFKEELENA